jgi:hypothetical protein
MSNIFLRKIWRNFSTTQSYCYFHVVKIISNKLGGERLTLIRVSALCREKVTKRKNNKKEGKKNGKGVMFVYYFLEAFSVIFF